MIQGDPEVARERNERGGEEQQGYREKDRGGGLMPRIEIRCQ